MELAYIDVPNEFAGAVIEKLGQRKGELRNKMCIRDSHCRDFGTAGVHRLYLQLQDLFQVLQAEKADS